MPGEYERFDIDHAGISAFLSGDEIRDVLEAAGRDVIALATPGLGQFTAGNWHNEAGPPRIIRGYPRSTQMVVNDHPAAAAREFGSGKGRAGNDEHRPQGGGNEPSRALGKAGAKVGDHKAGGIQEP